MKAPLILGRDMELNKLNFPGVVKIYLHEGSAFFEDTVGMFSMYETSSNI